MKPRFVPVVAALAAAVLTALIAGCGGSVGAGGAGTAPGTSTSGTVGAISNCGEKVTVAPVPAKAVTLNQSATELMLALGLKDHMAGTAFLDEKIRPDLAADYAKVPVLAAKYPSSETFLAAQPDFAYAAYASAFGKDGVGSRAELAGLGIRSYLSYSGCADKPKTTALTMDNIHREYREIAEVFGVPDRAAALIDDDDKTLAAARAKAAPLAGKTVLWWDSGTDSPFIGAGFGGPALMMREAGLTNIFADQPGSWASVSWESIVAADPDYIVIVNSSSDTASAKIDYLQSNPAAKTLAAARDKQYVTIPFPDATPGVRTADGVAALVDALVALPS